MSKIKYYYDKLFGGDTYLQNMLREVNLGIISLRIGLDRLMLHNRQNTLQIWAKWLREHDGVIETPEQAEEAFYTGIIFGGIMKEYHIGFGELFMEEIMYYEGLTSP